MTKISIIIPARNEAKSIGALLDSLHKEMRDVEIIVVNDGSDDDTAQQAQNHRATVLSHPYAMGNGAAVKTGARAANGDILVFMDADGQHQAKDIPRLLEPLERGIDMAVGARRKGSQASLGRAIGNLTYNRLASWMVGHRIQDLTSGFRAVNARKFREYLYLLPNGFSYPSTITMAFFRSGYAVEYVPITALKRSGKSHISPLKDATRFLLIIFKIGTLFSPLKLFFPVSLGFFTTGLSYYLYTYLTISRFTNMSALLFIVSMMIFMIGLVAEQITTLIYKKD